MRQETHYRRGFRLAIVFLLLGPAGGATAAVNAEPVQLETIAGANGRIIYVTKVLTSEHIFNSTETNSYGYPIAEPDKLELLGLLRAREYAELERILTAYQDAFEADFHKEFWVSFAFDAFHIADPSIKPLLDEWLEVNPESWAAHLARAEHFSGAGWQARGRDLAYRTSAEQFARMRHYLEFCVLEAQAALAARPKLLPAYVLLMNAVGGIGSLGAEDRSLGNLLDTALRECPECFTARRVYMHFLADKWHGTDEQRRAFVRETTSASAQNSLLSSMEGVFYELASEKEIDHLYIEGLGHDTGRPFTLNPEASSFTTLIQRSPQESPSPDTFDKGLELINKALEYDDFASFYYLRGYIDQLRGDHESALRDMERALAVAPQSVEYLVFKAEILNDVGRWQDAANILERAAELNPADACMLFTRGVAESRLGNHAKAEDAWRELLYYVPTEVRAQHLLACALHNQGKFEEAIPLFRAVLAEEPDHEYAHMWIGMSLEETGELEEAIEHYRLAVRNGFPQRFASHRLRAATAKVAPPFWWMMSQRLALLGFAVGLLVVLRQRRKGGTPPISPSAEPV